MVVKHNAKKETASPHNALVAVAGGQQGASALDKLIHERTRLAIVSALAVNASLSFTELKSLLAISDGNLSSHARKLEDAGYVRCDKRFENRVPVSQFTLTAAGRKALKHYIAHMESLLTAMKQI